MSHASLSKFAWTCLIVQIIFGILFTLLVRYDTSADAAYKDDNGQYVNQLGTNEELKENLEKYPGMSYYIHSTTSAYFYLNFINQIIYRGSGHQYDAHWWIWIFDDLSEKTWFFEPWFDHYDCGILHRMEYSVMGVHAHKCPVLLHQSKHDGVYI